MGFIERRPGQRKLIKGFCLHDLSVRGFTLIELIIAVSILAVIITAIYASLFNVLSTRENVQAKMDRLREFRRFSGIFSKEVRASFFSPSNAVSLWRGRGGTPDSADNASLSMTYFTYPAGKDPSGDLMAVSYSAEDTESGLTLYRESWNPYTGVKGGRAEVMEGIRGFEAQFYDGDKWVDSWDAETRKAVPLAVRISIGINALEGVRTLTATVETMVK